MKNDEPSPIFAETLADLPPAADLPDETLAFVVRDNNDYVTRNGGWMLKTREPNAPSMATVTATRKYTPREVNIVRQERKPLSAWRIITWGYLLVGATAGIVSLIWEAMK